MLIQLGFRGLRTTCIIGTQEHEREQEQAVESDLMVTVDVSLEQDDIAATLDYRLLAKLFVDHARSQQYFLLESMATGFKDLLMQTFPIIHSAVLEIRKPAALQNADTAFVRLEW